MEWLIFENAPGAFKYFIVKQNDNQKDIKKGIVTIKPRTLFSVS